MMWRPRAIRSTRLAPMLPARAYNQRRRWLRILSAALVIAALSVGARMLTLSSQAHSAGASDYRAVYDYLALGDSITFGFSPLVADANQANAFIGYPAPVAHALHLKLTNAACPGATSGSLISLSGTDWQCVPYRSAHPLHVSYTTSQLDYTVAFLLAHPRTRLVTINIGFNDVYRLRTLCGADNACIQNGLPNALATLAANLDTIYGVIRHTARYHGQIVALTYYSPANYHDVATDSIAALNRVVADRARAWGAVIADGFGAFEAASALYQGDPCAAGLLIRLSPTTCDLHPSVKGRNLLATAVLVAALHGDATPVAD